MSASNQLIVVGVDGSDASEQAVRWAAAVASDRNLELRIVHALKDGELYYGGDLAGTRALLEQAQKSAEQIVQDAVQIASLVDKDLTITTDFPTEPPVPLLIELSRDARMVVVGHTGRGGFPGMLAGSTAVALASHADCPVAVIRGRFGPVVRPEVGPVVVGVDDSPNSDQAIAMAFDEASRRDVPLVALHAWTDVSYLEPHGVAPLAVTSELLEEGEQRLLAQRLAGWQEKYPDVEVQREIVRARPRHALLDWSAKAQLVVVGSRGRGGFRGMLLGSTSQALVSHAQCPVLVARPRPGE